MQRVAANVSARRPTRLLMYGVSVALGILFLMPAHHRLWPVSFLAVATAPVVDGVRVRSQPGRTRARAIEAPGDLAQELAALEADGYIVLTEVQAAREIIPFVVIGPTGAFAIRQISWAGQFSMRRDGWFQHSKGDAGELVWHASRESMALSSLFRKSHVAVPVHGIVVATRSTVRGHDRSIDLGKVSFVESIRLAGFVEGRRQKISPQKVSAAIGALGE
jgi:Nuclease-related domain